MPFSYFVGRTSPFSLHCCNMDIRVELKQDTTSHSYTRREQIFLTAAYFASLCDYAAKAECVAPTVYRALPLIKKLASRIGDDDADVAVFATFVNQLIAHDVDVLMKKADKN